jgi:outer membrane protein OmpA-like peptidoglycan-associated protein/tetratricopeptide (TPR) repeat protein
MRKTRLLTIVMVLLLGVAAQCQPIEQAKKLMLAYNYTKAITLLEREARYAETRDQAAPLLAECYRMQKNFAGMRAWYSESVKLPGVKPESFLYYGQALQSTGDYYKAKEMYLEYARRNPSDSRGLMYAAACDSVNGPWLKTPALFDVKNATNVNTTASDFGPSVYANGFTFASDRRQDLMENNKYGWTGNNYLDLFYAEPKTKGDFYNEISTPKSMKSHFNQEYHDGPASFANNDQLAFITRTFKDKAKREDGFRTNLLKMFYSEKADGKWSAFKPFFLNSEDYSVGHPALTPDGKTLYFVSDMPGGLGGTDIWACKKEGDKWGTPKNLGSPVNTSGDEMFPEVAPDGSLYFSSNTLPGYGGLDIFKTRLVDNQWKTPVNLKSPANSSYDDFAMAWSSNMQTGLLSSNRPGGVGLDDIYSFNKLPEPEPVIPPEPKKPALVSGYVKDKTNMQPVANATVFMWNKCSGKVFVAKTDANGKYTVPVEEACNYLVKALQKSYMADCLPITYDKIEPGANLTIPSDLLLDKLTVTKSWKVENIYYDFDKWNIRMDAKPGLDKLVSIMKENPITVELGSHTDCRGTFEYNDRLSQRRAESAVQYIVSQGIDAGRITAKGYGEHQLTNKCADGVKCTEAEHQLNRRTEVRVTDLKVETPENEQFDGSKYKAGELLDVKSLNNDFFLPCK